MTKKLLIITAGTVAASVGEELKKQMKAHPRSDLDVMVRYIDTAYLPYRYGTLRNGEWFQMNIGQRYMDAIYKRIKEFDEYPRIKNMLFPNLLPGTAVTGGGSIRYNGAGAVEVQRESIQKWLSGSMAELAQRGNKETNISMALIISAVGATGSGSLEHLIEVIVDAAYHARIKSTTQSNIRCDVFILQPGRQGVTELGLANTLALYAELAASQLTLHSSTGRQYQGRKIMVDWGSTLALSSINQLREAAATLIRLSSDSSTSFAAEFQEREVDNHVLRELDPISNLPMHLSTATIVTISLGDLVEQVTQRDAAKLIESLVFGKTQHDTSNVFLSKVSQVLAGESGIARYRKLIEHLSSDDVRKKLVRLDRTSADSGSSTSEKVNRLSTLYQELQRDIRQSTRSVQNKAHKLIDNTLEEIERAKYELVSSNSYSLFELREEYNALENTVKSALEEAIKDVETTKVNEEAVNRQIRDLQSARPMNLFGQQQERLQRLVSTMKRNLQGLLSEVARESALAFLEEIQNHCARIGRNLDVILEKLDEQRTKREGWAVAYRDFGIETEHPLYLMALSTPEQIEEYTKRVSIFSARKRGISSSGTDQILDFRKWLEGKRELFEDLFEGEVERVTQVALSYTSEKVRDGVSDKTVLDILLEAGDKVLIDRLKEAATKTVSLVSYDEDFAPDRREIWHVSAQYTLDQREKLQKAMEEAIKGQSTLLSSNDPTEIAIYYYVDGIPMSAVDDLKGRCLQAFLKRRQQWYRQQPSLNGNGPISSLGGLNQRVGVPVYSGQDAEDRVIETGVIQRLYEVKGVEVDDFSKDNNIRELKPPKPATPQENRTNGQVHAGNDQTQTAPTSEQDASSTDHSYSSGYQAQTNPAAGQDDQTAQTPPPDQQNGADQVGQGIPTTASASAQSKPQQ